MSERRSLFSPVRFLAGVVVVGVLMVPAYFLLIHESADALVQRAAILDTSASDGRGVGLELGDQAPDFEFSTPEGRRQRLSDFRGRPLVVNFWATWCTSCLTEMPDLKALQGEMGGDAFQVLAVNAGEARPKAQEFIDFLDAPFVYALDPNLVLSDAYGVYGLPLSVFLDANGVVRGVYRGHAQPEVLDTFVRAAIDAEPPDEIPVVLRTVSTIHRPRSVIVTTTGPGHLAFTSKALRCDLSFCAEPTLLAGLTELDGIESASIDESDDGLPQLTVEFDEATITDGEVVAAIRTLLDSLDDPLYQLPIEFVYESQ